MALSTEILEKIDMYGGAMASGHRHIEAHYTRALLNEDSAVWGDLYLYAMAAKASHYALKMPENSDAMPRGIVTSEPSTGPGSRGYKVDFNSEQWWRSTAPGAAYYDMLDEVTAGLLQTPLVCF